MPNRGGVMNKKWMLLGIIGLLGCTEKDPHEEAKQELEHIARQSKEGRSSSCFEREKREER